MLSTASKQSSITEDVFLAVGSLTAALDTDFTRYVQPFAPHLYTALQSPDEHQVRIHFGIGKRNIKCQDI